MLSHVSLVLQECIVDDEIDMDEAAQVCLLNTLQPGGSLVAAGRKGKERKEKPRGTREWKGKEHRVTDRNGKERKKSRRWKTRKGKEGTGNATCASHRVYLAFAQALLPFAILLCRRRSAASQLRCIGRVAGRGEADEVLSLLLGRGGMGPLSLVSQRKRRSCGRLDF